MRHRDPFEEVLLVLGLIALILFGLLVVRPAHAAEPQSLASLIHWYHGAVALGGLLAIFGTVHRLWIAPIQAWRKEVERRIVEVEKQQALDKQRMESGDRKFTELVADIKEIKACLQELKVAVASSVWQGVGGSKEA